MKHVFIIAEAGVNHNGSLDNAKRMVECAAEAGADAIKFQTFKAETLVCKNAQKAEYQKETTGNEESQFEMLKKLELTEEEYAELKQHCGEKHIMFLSTPFDLDSLRYLNEIGIEIIKIPSGEITNYPYLREIGKLGKPIIMSTGMSTMAEVEEAVEVLQMNGAQDITLLHCNTQYPTPYGDVNLRAMLALKDKFHTEVGYSDHTLGIEVPIAATAMGATVIEKHFTLNRGMEGPDHKASLEPDELKCMIRSIRNVEQAMGTGIKEPTNSEYKNILVARKSIVARKQIQAGEIFTEENITTKRPGDGMSPMRWNEVIGKTASREYGVDEKIVL